MKFDLNHLMYVVCISMSEKKKKKKTKWTYFEKKFF